MNTQTEEKQWNELALSHAKTEVLDVNLYPDTGLTVDNKTEYINKAAWNKLHEWATKRVKWLQGFYDQDERLLSTDARQELTDLKEIIKQLA